MKHLVSILLLLGCTLSAIADERLQGQIIGSPATTGGPELAFDGNLNTYYASTERDYTWVGLDLGSPHVITRVGWAPRSDSYGPGRVLLAVFEGANRPDFMDALPLYIVPQKGTIGSISYANVACSRGFRYVRYVTPADSRCNVAEVEFYGHSGEGDDSQLCQLTNLPTVSIHTQDGVIPYDKVNQIPAQLTLIWDEGRKHLSEPGTIRERGNGSRTFPKRPYRIKFDQKQRVMESPAKAKKWTLINNYGDKTLMRNLLAFELSRIMKMPYTPYAQSVDVLLNGEYKGNYQLCDQVQVHKGRVELTEMTPTDNTGSALTGGYLLEVDAYASQEPSWFNSSLGNPVTIQSPDEDSITTQQFNYIRSYFNSMERQWANRLDLNTFLRHFLVGEYSGNTDTYWSVFMYKQRDNDTLFTGPVWDFDLAFENDNRTYPINNKSDYIYRSGGSCAGNMKSFVDRIVVQTPSVKPLLQAIWGQARTGGLTEEHLIACVDSLAEVLQESQRLNFLRWPIMNQYVHQNPRTWGSYEAEVENVRRYIRERIVWMDKKLDYTYDGLATTGERPSSDVIYNLQGVAMGHDLHVLPPGLYIYRGKKLLLK